MKKKINKAISEHFRELGKKSWKARKARILGVKKPVDKPPLQTNEGGVESS